MLSWFKKKLGSAQDIPPEQAQGAEAEAALPVAVTSEQQENGPKFFLRLKDGLSRTRKTFVRQIDALFLGKRKIDAELLEDLEEILIMADIGANTTQELLGKTREQVRRNELGDGQALKKALKEMILGYLLNADRPADLALPSQGPFVVMVLGVNGVGKTTTIGKLAHKFTQAGQKVLLVAADTFRAAASEQLQIWGKRVGVEVVAQQAGADPSSVVYDALDYARPRNFDVVLVDTAGRLHTKVNLMEELKKIKRVMDKKIPGAPHEILLVLDATTGQNAISQARLFNEAVEVTGLALTKLDGTAKGGIVINISHEFNIPIRFIGIGEQMEDLRDFEPNEFVEALFAEGEA
jgi:fused signal recognition particle receptor